VHALRREFIHCARIALPQLVSGWDASDGFLYQPYESFILCDPGDVRLWILERKDLLGHKFGEVLQGAANRLILNRL
jgi:hypothetical protein